MSYSSSNEKIVFLIYFGESQELKRFWETEYNYISFLATSFAWSALLA